VHALLGLETLEDVLGHPVAGASWEGMVLESALAAAGDVPAYFYRTATGAEVDLVIEGRHGRRYAVEIKRSSAPSAGRGLRNGCADIGAAEAIVVYPGEERFPLGDGIEAVGVREAMVWIRERTAGG